MDMVIAIIIVFSFLHALADASTIVQGLEQVQEAQRQYQAQAQYFPKPQTQVQTQTFQAQMQVQTQTFQPQPLGQPHPQAQQNQVMQPPTQGQQNQGQGLQPPAQGQQNQGQGLQPPTQGQGLQPPTQGKPNLGQGQQPPAQGQPNQPQQPPAQGQQNQPPGLKPPAQGQQNPGQGLQPPAQGQQNPGQGLQPPAQGKQNPGQGLQPPAQGQPQVPTPVDQTTLHGMYDALAAAKPQAYLAAHNLVRQQMKVPPLQWDKKLEDYAFNYGSKLAKENCIMKHSNGPYGENLFWELYEESTPAQVVQSFASEQENYDFQKGVCKCSNSGKCMCGHFTAIIWKTTERVGCAEVRCDAEKGKMVVCSYDPKGNLVGEDPLKDKHDL